ncbi:MAG TPA: Crp/Fnr family transcriptional regulator [Terriglobales bacterium]|nr:Crp/Fnr family transcriptional regulator [Terriglobales bacterium]
MKYHSAGKPTSLSLITAVQITLQTTNVDGLRACCTNPLDILKEGSVKCVKTSPGGKEVTLRVLMPEDLFCCDAAVFEGGTHPGCAQPMGDVNVLRLSKKAYYDLLRRNPDAALDVIKYLGHRLNEAQENAKLLAMDRAEQRMASLLIKLAARAGVREPDGIRLTVRLTRQDLADMAGIAVETATRIMGQFKRAGLVRSPTADYFENMTPIIFLFVAFSYPCQA